MLLIDQLLWLPLVTYCWSSVGLPQDRRWLNIYQVFIERLSNIWSNHFEGHFVGDHSKFFLAFIDTFFKRQEILMNEKSYTSHYQCAVVCLQLARLIAVGQPLVLRWSAMRPVVMGHWSSGGPASVHYSCT